MLSKTQGVENHRFGMGDVSVTRVVKLVALAVACLLWTSATNSFGQAPETKSCVNMDNMCVPPKVFPNFAHELPLQLSCRPVAPRGEPRIFKDRGVWRLCGLGRRRQAR